VKYFSLLNIMVAPSKEGRTTTSKVVIAIVIALGLMGAVAVTVVIIQQAEAKGCIGNNINSRAFNASLGRCAHP
jgi:hypothetical protein